MLASASDDKYVHVWDMSAKKELYRLKHDGPVNCVSFHNDLIFSASTDKSVRIWKKSTGKKVVSLEHKGNCWNFDISPNGALIAIAKSNGASVWTLENYNKPAELIKRGVADVRFQKNEKVFTTSHDGQCTVYLIKNDCTMNK